ncbi:MAG: YIP1 family protein [Bacteroidetes bacterium]|nr:YIP1 family protein [Bacteroidota bacterium]
MFSTIWGLIESPRGAFRQIVLAKHKNYSLMLSALFGISLALEIAWYKSLLQTFPRTEVILGGALLLGPVFGIVVVFLAAVLLKKATAVLGGIATHKNLFAALAYAMMPMVLGLFFLVPIALAVFGSDFFGVNPPPMVIKPLEYKVLMVLKGIVVLYSLYLAVEATLAANALTRKRFLTVMLIVFGMAGAGLVALHYVTV